MEAVDFNELLQRGGRETPASDTGSDARETEPPTGDRPTITPCKTDKKGYRHWEIRRLTHASGTPDYFQHRDGRAKSGWKHGLPEGLKKADMVPAAAGSSPSPESESPQGRQQGAQRPATTSPGEAPRPGSTLTPETATTTPEILQAVAQYIQPDCPPDKIPGSETLATWVTNECPGNVRAAADTLLTAIWKRSAGGSSAAMENPARRPAA